VRITDAAIVAAATLSNRYIADRFLPDKAIDLMDEAASRIRMEVEQARGDREPRPADHPAQDRGNGARQGNRPGRPRTGSRPARGTGQAEQQSSELTTRWQNERDKIAAEGKIKEAARRLRGSNWNRRSAQGDLAKAGELSYGTIPRAGKAAGRGLKRVGENACCARK
jgi:ATP-dependent Clp protease ATP-binding subunit ClpB